MIPINLKKIFEQAGLEDPRPTDQALERMGISRRRFSQLLDNKHVNPITVPELEALKNWIEEIKSIDPELIIGDYSSHQHLADSLGLSKE